MSLLVETIRVGVPAVLVPSGVFAFNWIYRQKKGYAQNAAGDFALALITFDLGIVAASESLHPFVKNPDLRTIIISWHLSAMIVTGFIWHYVIQSWGEPKLAEWYGQNSRRRRANSSPLPPFPYVPCAACWATVIVLVAARTAFFMI